MSLFALAEIFLFGAELPPGYDHSLQLRSSARLRPLRALEPLVRSGQRVGIKPAKKPAAAADSAFQRLKQFG